MSFLKLDVQGEIFKIKFTNEKKEHGFYVKTLFDPNKDFTGKIFPETGFIYNKIEMTRKRMKE